MEAYVLRITGRVQGVGFRWFVERAASRYGVRGYVRNLQDGSVEVLAQGTTAALEGFRRELREGPPASRVDDIQVTQLPVDQKLMGFELRF